VLPQNWETIIWSRDIPAPRSCVCQCLCALLLLYITHWGLCMMHTSGCMCQMRICMLADRHLISIGFLDVGRLPLGKWPFPKLFTALGSWLKIGQWITSSDPSRYGRQLTGNWPRDPWLRFFMVSMATLKRGAAGLFNVWRNFFYRERLKGYFMCGKGG
jgi:hypothetical protein